jgi:hypothetical protein
MVYELTNRIGRVSDNNIEGINLVLEEWKAISDMDFDFVVLESSSHDREELFGSPDNTLLN